MPKLKPHKGLRKRVRVSANGKISYRRSHTGHLMSNKSGRRKQRLRRRGTAGGRLAESILLALCNKS
ncbi:MAG: 50S ribosomal protein L35 [Phycisphaerae bacterium]|nr:50S ribosomal protein L35 [Phycisphaerae bacterium]